MEPEIVERVPLRSCARRGAAIDVVADRGREHRSQIVFTRARGREMVFWQSPRTRKQARPDVRLPTARAPGSPELEIVVDATSDTHTGSPAKPVRTAEPCGWPCGDYAVAPARRREAGRRGRAQVAGRSGVQPDRRPVAVRPGRAGRPAPRRGGGRGPLLAGVHPRPGPAGRWWPTGWPSCRSAGRRSRSCSARPGALAEEWTYRYLAAAATLGRDRERRHRPHRADPQQRERADEDADGTAGAPDAPAPSTAEVRAWARANGIEVPDRGRLRPAGPSGLARRAPGDPSLPSPPLSGPGAALPASTPTSGVRPVTGIGDGGRGAPAHPRRSSSRRRSRFSPWACSSAARRAWASCRCCFLRCAIWPVRVWTRVLSASGGADAAGVRGGSWARRCSMRPRRSGWV